MQTKNLKLLKKKFIRIKNMGMLKVQGNAIQE